MVIKSKDNSSNNSSSHFHQKLQQHRFFYSSMITRFIVIYYYYSLFIYYYNDCCYWIQFGMASSNLLSSQRNYYRTIKRSGGDVFMKTTSKTSSAASYINSYHHHQRNTIYTFSQLISTTIKTKSLLLENYHRYHLHRRLLLSSLNEDDSQSNDHNDNKKLFHVDNDNINLNKLPRIYVGDIRTKPIVLTSLQQLPSNTKTHNNNNISKKLYHDAIVCLTPDQSHYVTNVLRLSSSTTRKKRTTSNNQQTYIRIFDESMEEWLAEILMSSNQDELNNTKRKSRNNIETTVTLICRSMIRSLYKSSSSELIDHHNHDNHYGWLCIAPPKKKDRIRWLIEKTTELNIAGYIWLDTDYTQNQQSQSQEMTLSVPFDKLQSYTIEASEQCERLSLPYFIHYVPHNNNNINDQEKNVDSKSKDTSILFRNDKSSKIGSVPTTTTKLIDFLKGWEETYKSNNNNNKKKIIKLFICRERINTIPIWNALDLVYSTTNSDTTTTTFDDNDDTATMNNNDMKQQKQQNEIHIVFLIGPEGGWSPYESNLLNKIELQYKDTNDIINISLGSNILRCETAAITVTAIYSMFLNHYYYK